MTANGNGELSIEELRERYRIEREKRLRSDGVKQYAELKGEYQELDVDTYADPSFTRDPITEDTHVVVVGGGFAGMLTAINLTKQGVTDFRIVEKAGDFGGTWYWNRYPGCMCDVESYTYLPMLEATGYMPTERYASASEIFEYCKLLGQTFDLYPHALFQTVITGAEWDDGSGKWIVTTSRGDRITTKFVVVAGGILHKPKLPGIPGITEYQGKMFHTSHWDYDYTGGSPKEPMDKLAGKRVGIVGTGATAVQAVPQLAKTAEELYVFQRTPSAVGERNNAPTDVEWFKGLQPGWQAERIENFTHAVTGVQPEQDLVHDGWTEVMWVNTQKACDDPEEAAALERSDFETMEKLRRRVDTIVEDPETAAKLKPYYGKNCKRVCFHDEYLPAFNQPNVHLVDTDGKGVQQITATGAVVDGVEYPLDCLIFASGFETNTDYDGRVGFDPVGRDGISLSERWSEGARTLHGILSGGFPNFFIISFLQAGFGTNFVHFLGKSAEHVAEVIVRCDEEDIATIEATPEAEDEWLMVLYGTAAGAATYSASCTPGYYNSEQGEVDAKGARNLVYAGSLLDYAGYLERWRETDDLPGALITRAG
ncbi:MAG: NAD(P)/FAD-dependent oxidoreductase [Actinobacteria bacterium]|nr:NAD(P)/FAD-dependent oxidoreductase [Actinomycetota bacterium]